MCNVPGVRTAVLVLAAAGAGCAGRTPPDEAKLRLLGSGPATRDRMQEVAAQYYPPAGVDYFKDMDAAAPPGGGPSAPPALKPDEVVGRNAWVLWAGGNEAFWDWLARHGYGAIDLLKVVDSTDRGRRFARRGLLTEPGTRPPTDDETRAAHGVRYDRIDEARHVEAVGSDEERQAHWRIYGYPSGVVGLRLFPNPEFDRAAERRWDAHRYYTDPDYAARPDTVRPFRVGMSCGFCHIAPHPLAPPADPEFPEWRNLSNNIGNQYLRFRTVFANTLRADSYLYHVLDAQHPGTIDTSLIAADNVNNPNTVNAFFGLPARIERARHNPRETIGGDTLAYLREYNQKDFENPHLVPRVLLDGADSVGVELALARVYLNIGTYHQQWVRLHNPLLGFRSQEPFKLKDCAENSVYWHATRLRVGPLAAFFKATTAPMRLRDAAADPKEKGLLGAGVPWDRNDTYAKGRAAFAKGCVACHSGFQPGDNPALEALVRPGKDESLPQPDGLPADWGQLSDADRQRLAAARTGLRLRPDDLARLTRGDGQLPPGYALWARKAVELEAFWADNYLSTDQRIPVTLTRTNSARAVATNGVHGHMWEDFSSQTYKELDSVGRVGYRDPFSGADKSFAAPGGGRGYYRVPTLISAWATAPFLHNNALGLFNNDPSVRGRLAAYDDAMRRLLWPEARAEPTRHRVWHVPKDGLERAPEDAYNGWAIDKANPDDAYRKAAAQVAADGGWVWRLPDGPDADAWVVIPGHQIPVLTAGLTGWAPAWVRLLPWVPSVALVALGVLLLLGGRVVAAREWADRRAPWLAWALGPVRWLLAVGSVVLAGGAGYLVWWRYWYLIELVDVATSGSIPWLGLQASALPVFLLAAGVLFGLHQARTMTVGRRVARAAGAVCLLLAVVLAVGLGRFLSGRGGDVRFGPIPGGTPVNVIANLDPDAPPAAGRAARKALIEFVLAYHRDPAVRADARQAFAERVAPALMAASKCPDLVTDRGHDYEFVRHLTDDEKKALAALVKTF